MNHLSGQLKMSAVKILVVDDSVENLKIIISLIEEHKSDAMIFQANSGIVALKVIDRITPDIVITDWDMPEMSGIELIRTMQADTRLKAIPVIVATGVMLTPQNLKTALAEGATDYIRKPIEAVELIARINSAIRISAYYNQLVKEKESKIVENYILLNQRNNYLDELSKKIGKIIKPLNKTTRIASDMENLLNDIKGHISDKGWRQFALAFNNLHPEFEKRLLRKHRALTEAEIKLSMMIRLGIKNKGLAEMMFVTPDSIRVLRSRLRKKLGISSDLSLYSYLSSI